MARELAVAIAGAVRGSKQRRKGSLAAGATDGGKAALLSLRGWFYMCLIFFLFGGDDSLMMEANFTS